MCASFLTVFYFLKVLYKLFSCENTIIAERKGNFWQKQSNNLHLCEKLIVLGF